MATMTTDIDLRNPTCQDMATAEAALERARAALDSVHARPDHTNDELLAVAVAHFHAQQAVEAILDAARYGYEPAR